MSREQPSRPRAARRFPRVSGDEPRVELGKGGSDPFSPRERG